MPAEAYHIHVDWDPSKQGYSARVEEVEHIHSFGATRLEALRDCEERLQRACEQALDSGVGLAKPFQLSEEEFVVRLRGKALQDLHRAARERGKGVQELLQDWVAAYLRLGGKGVEDPNDGIGNRKMAPENRGGGFKERQHHAHHGNRKSNNKGRGGANNARFHKTMESGEHFLEYVRNLEKSGGGAQGWRKK